MVWLNEQLKVFRTSREEITASYVVEYLMNKSSREPETHGLMPRLEDTAKPDYNFGHRRTYVVIEPFQEFDNLGEIGFDLRVGPMIAESDICITKGLSDEDLREMPHKILDPGETYIMQGDPLGERVYYVVVHEIFGPSKDLEAIIDSKSTSARVGVMTHVAGKTKEGNMILGIRPRSFPIEVTSAKTSLSQVAIRYKGTPYLNNGDIEKSEICFLEGTESILEGLLNSHGMLMLFKTKVPFYRAKTFHKDMAPINMDAKGTVGLNDYFEICDPSDKIDAERNRLYLVGSYGSLSLGKVCGFLSKQEGVLSGTGAWGCFAGILQPFRDDLSITMEYFSPDKVRISNASEAGYVIFDAVEGSRKSQDKLISYNNQPSPQLPRMFKSSI
jgi:hypothetical protein